MRQREQGAPPPSFVRPEFDDYLALSANYGCRPAPKPQPPAIHRSYTLRLPNGAAVPSGARVQVIIGGSQLTATASGSGSIAVNLGTRLPFYVQFRITISGTRYFTGTYPTGSDNRTLTLERDGIVFGT